MSLKGIVFNFSFLEEGNFFKILKMMDGESGDRIILYFIVKNQILIFLLYLILKYVVEGKK